MTPESLANGSVLMGEGEEVDRSTTTTTNVVEVRGGGGRNDFEDVSVQLQARGVHASLRQLLVTCSLEAIASTIQWWDGEQVNERPPGPGVLVETIRRGGMTERQRPKSTLEQQRDYGDLIMDWLKEHFPELCDEKWGPHPAAITAVIHLHARHGKGRITKAAHGSQIRAAVKAFDKKWGTE